MTANQEVKIAIDDSFTQHVCNYSVGFLKFRSDGKFETAEPSGTGTFAKLGKVYGILTAGHVLKEMDTKEVVGLARFPSIKPPLQNFRLNLDHTERIIIWNERNGEAPDIAYLKIPQTDAARLEAEGGVFYNLALTRNFAPSKPEHNMSKAYAIVGVIGEWTEYGQATHTKGRKINLGGLFGAVKNFREFKESGTDLIDVEIDYAEGPRIPKSYGGVSGGGLWELHVELDDQRTVVNVNKRLHGVAFRQSADHRIITSNAAPSIEEIADRVSRLGK